MTRRYDIERRRYFEENLLLIGEETTDIWLNGASAPIDDPLNGDQI